MVTSRENPHLSRLVLDIILLLVTPLVLGPVAGVLFFFLYPLPAILFAIGVTHLSAATISSIQKIFKYIVVLARGLLTAILLLSILNTTISLPQYSYFLSSFFEPNVLGSWALTFHILSQVLIMTLLIKTYNSYFSYKYQLSSIRTNLGVYVLEFFVFILAYICAIIATQFLIAM